MAGAVTDEVHEAMDWLLAQKGKIEKQAGPPALERGRDRDG